MANETGSKVVLTASFIGFAALAACSGPLVANDSGTDANVADVASDTPPIDTGTDVQAMDRVVPTDTPIAMDVVTTDTARTDGSTPTCVVTSAVADHTALMATNGWAAANRAAGLLMYGCTAGMPATDCLSTVPLADDTNIGATRSALAAQHLRVLYSTTNSSSYWTRISPDGRFVGRGTHVRDLVRSVEVEAGPTARYDPAFFPDNSRFMYQPDGHVCPLNILTNGTPTHITFSEIGCSQTTVGLYEHLGVSLGGGDYWATSAGAAAWDDGGHMPTLHDPDPNSPWRSGAQTTLTLMGNTGTSFTNIATAALPTPYQGDGVISPSSTLLMTRVADSTGNNQTGYRLHRLTTMRTGSAVTASLSTIADYCIRGAKPAFSLDERWVAMHAYVTAEDATELGFTGPSDPAFAQYLSQGASNIYLLDLATGTRTRLTNMGPGQYALYPAFRSDGWIYFLVRTLGRQAEHVIASDAALVTP